MEPETTSTPSPIMTGEDPQETTTPVEEPSETESAIHGFLNNTTNVTVIEKPADGDPKKCFCEGSDSGVEVVDTVDFHRALSSNSGASHQDCDNVCARSCDSSISYCSNYEEAYNILVRKNSTLLEDYTLRNGDVTSENGSESSSLSGSQNRCRRGAVGGVKKTPDRKKESTSSLTKDKTRSKPPITPTSTKSTASTRLKSVDRLQTKPAGASRTNSACRTKPPVPSHLDLAKTHSKRPSSGRPTTTNTSRLPIQGTPSDDGRSPTTRPSPSMIRSFKDPKPRLSQLDSKTIEKYATLPRRRKEKDKPIDSAAKTSTINVKKSSNNQLPPSKLFSSLYLPKAKPKIKIYHEINVQTALTMCDIEQALAGALLAPKSPEQQEKCSKEVQVDMRDKEVEKLKEQLKNLTAKYDNLTEEHKGQTEKLKETEEKLKVERLEKDGLREELHTNSQRVLAILGQVENNGCQGK